MPTKFKKQHVVHRVLTPFPQDYPFYKKRNYLVFEIVPVNDPEFENLEWDFKRLKNYSAGNASAWPFTTNLTELMKNKIR